jgi:hypothetical protein
MPAITIIYGTLLVLLGAAGYFGTGATSPTALIPAVFGVPVLLLGLLARAKPGARMHAMHGAVLLALVGFIGSFRGLTKLPALLSGQPVERPTAVAAQSAMALLSIVFVALCVKSFVDARRARGAPPPPHA